MRLCPPSSTTLQRSILKSQTGENSSKTAAAYAICLRNDRDSDPDCDIAIVCELGLLFKLLQSTASNNAVGVTNEPLNPQIQSTEAADVNMAEIAEIDGE
jgi:hypothetical protein